MYIKYFKRLIDIFFSFLALPFVIILCIIFGTLIYLEDKGDIFYIAKRRGVKGEIFDMYKLRSMNMNAPDIRNEDNSTYNSKNDRRVTKVGKILRKTSIDELPQVFNILKGDMSWVGPRPITIDRPLNQYDKKRIDRLKVRPGITGYSQAYYRNNISQEEKLQLDADYAKNISFFMDCKIVLKTIQVVVMQENVYTN